MRTLYALALAALVAGCTSAQIGAAPDASSGEATSPASTSAASGGTPATAEPEPTKPTVTATQDAWIVKMDGFAFVPGWVEARVGDKVTWRNLDGAIHTVNADLNRTFESGPIEPGAEWSYTFQAPGSYAFHCNYHASMTGTVRVS